VVINLTHCLQSADILGFGWSFSDEMYVVTQGGLELMQVRWWGVVEGE
jgi:hypothetical protein